MQQGVITTLISSKQLVDVRAEKPKMLSEFGVRNIVNVVIDRLRLASQNLRALVDADNLVIHQALCLQLPYNFLRD